MAIFSTLHVLSLVNNRIYRVGANLPKPTTGSDPTLVHAQGRMSGKVTLAWLQKVGKTLAWNPAGVRWQCQAGQLYLPRLGQHLSSS